jgi:hypothetical protein
MARKDTVEEQTDGQPVTALASLTPEQLRECLELGATLAEIKELVSAGYSAEAIASLASLLVANRSGGGDMARMMSVLQQQQATMQESVERSRPKENPHYKANSIFLQENGEPWAKQLKCEIYLGSINYNKSPLTKPEVDALNLIQPVVKATITKNDGAPLLVAVLPKADAVGRLSRLTIAPYVAPGQNPGDAMFEKNLNLTMPSIIAMATELAAQAQVAA